MKWPHFTLWQSTYWMLSSMSCEASSMAGTDDDIGIDKYAVVVHHAMISWYFFISAGVSKSRFFEAQDFMAVL